jgi:hypothetical protein
MFEMEKGYLRADGSILQTHVRSFIVSNDVGEPICEMEIIEPINQTVGISETLLDKIIAAFNFPEMSCGLLPV